MVNGQCVVSLYNEFLSGKCWLLGMYNVVPGGCVDFCSFQITWYRLLGKCLLSHFLFKLHLSFFIYLSRWNPPFIITCIRRLELSQNYLNSISFTIKKITSCTLKIIEHQDLNKHLGTRKAKQIGKIKLGCWISEFGKI